MTFKSSTISMLALLMALTATTLATPSFADSDRDNSGQSDNDSNDDNDHDSNDDNDNDSNDDNDSHSNDNDSTDDNDSHSNDDSSSDSAHDREEAACKAKRAAGENVHC